MKPATPEIDPLLAEFEDRQLERRFQEYIRPTRVRDTRLAVTLGAVFYALFAFTDYLNVGAGFEYTMILVTRLAVAALGIGAALLAERYWRWLVNGVIPTVVVACALSGLLLITLKRPFDIGWHGMSMLAMLLAGYIFIPNRFMPSVVVAVFASLGFLWLMWVHFNPGPNIVVTLIVILLVVNIVGAMAAYRVSRMQHLAFLDGMVRQEANEALRDEVARREGLEEDLRHLLEMDYLTDLPNRASFFERAGQLIEQAGRNGTPLSFLVVDIDYFRQINGTFGHSRGDEVLQELAGRCQGRLTPGAICARLGGDDFALLMPDMGLAAARDFAEALRLDIRRASVDLGDSGLRFTVSMGLAQWYSGESINSLLRRADHALSAAKYHGRDRVELASESGPSGGVMWS